MGAVASGGVCVMNPDIVNAFAVPVGEVTRVIAEAEREIRRRELAFRGDRPPVDVHGSTVILVDDGIATGATVRAAVSIASTWKYRPSRSNSRPRRTSCRNVA